MKTIDEITSSIRQKADECHNNNGSRTWEDWERMTKYLLSVADGLDDANCRVSEMKKDLVRQTERATKLERQLEESRRISGIFGGALNHVGVDTSDPDAIAAVDGRVRLRCGNSAKMREVLEYVDGYLAQSECVTVFEIDALRQKIHEALAIPPRNCDLQECQTAQGVLQRVIHDGVADLDFGARNMAEYMLSVAKTEEGDEESEV